MFKSKTGKIDPNTTDTLIGEGTVFDGKIKSTAGIRIEGKVIGDVDCGGDVTVGEKGNVQSNVIARNVMIAGEIHGNVTAKGKLTISAKGKLFGNILAGSLSIEEGGVFQGNSRMETASTVAKKDTQAQSETKEPSQPSRDGQNYNGQDAAIKTW